MNTKIISFKRENHLVIFSGILLVTFLFAATLFMGVPMKASAATYAYVNTSGSLSYVNADSATQAFANSVNIASNSGVMLVGEQVTNVIYTPNTVYYVNTNTSNLTGYMYVNTSGQVVQVSATSATEAFAKSVNIAPHSGVMSIDSVSDSQMVGDQVVIR